MGVICAQLTETTSGLREARTLATIVKHFSVPTKPFEQRNDRSTLAFASVKAGAEGNANVHAYASFSYSLLPD